MFPFTKIFAGALGLSLIALAVVMWRADAISAERDTLQTWQDDVTGAVRLASGQTELPTDRVGAQILAMSMDVKELERAIQTTNAEASLRAAEFEYQQRLALEEIDRFKAAARQSDRRIDRFREIADRAESCPASAELMNALEGL